MSSAEFKNGVSFSEDVEKVTDAPAHPPRHAPHDRNYSLTQSEVAWDIDGDGVLDDTEMALKKRDKSRKGFLSKDQMYDLMEENLKTQRDLFKVKKVVAGLVAFTCVLALSNLGTSFAAAFLAKDTTSQNGQLTDTKTRKMLGTDTATNVHVSNNKLSEKHEQRRRLACQEIHGSTSSFKQCAVNNFAAFDVETGRDIVNTCDAGGSVTIRKLFNGGNNHVDHTICTLQGDQREASKGKNPTLTISKAVGGILKVRPEGKGNDITYVAEGLALNGLGIVCNADADCAANLRCEMDDTAGHNLCKGVNLHTCTMNMNECAANHDCLQTGYHEYARRGLGEALPAPEEGLIVMPTLEGQCTCLSSAACDGDMVCRDDCSIPDLPIQCHDQTDLDQMCKNIYIDDGMVCAQYVAGSESACVLEASVFDG